jgi:hypothetical protein
MFARRRMIALAVLGGLVLVLATAAACGSSSSTSNPPSASASPATASAAALVKANWEAFFSGTTAAAKKISLLQNGQQFAKTIQAQAGSAIAKGSAAAVTDVKITSPSTATVTYSITLNGATALPNQTGQAFLEGGVWKVGAQSFSALLALEGQAPSASPTK